MRHQLKLLLVGIVGLFPLLGAADEPFPLEPLVEGPHGLQVVGDHLETVIPVEPRDGLSDIKVVVAWVRHENLDSSELVAATDVRLEPPTVDGAPWRLVVSLRADELSVRTGSFHLRLRAQGVREVTEDSKRTEKPGPWVDTEIELERTPVTLSPPDAIHLWETRFVGLTLDRTVDKFHVGFERGAPPELIRWDRADLDDREVAGSIEVTAPEPGRPPSRAFEARIIEDFPVGDATGKVHIGSRDSASVQIPYTVHTRQHWALIFVAAWLGIFLGWFVRVGLAARVQRSRTLLQLGEAERRIRRLKSEIQDATFHQAMDEQLEQVARLVRASRNALKPEAVEQISTDMAAIGTAVDEALQAVETERATLQQQISDAQTALSPAWILPEPVGAPVGDARARLVAATEMLGSFRLGSARKELEAATAAALATHDAWLGWRSEAKRGLSRLLAIDPPMPAPCRAIAENALEALGPGASGSKAGTELTAACAGEAHTAYNALGNLARQLPPSMGRSIQSAIDKLRRGPLRDPAAVDKLDAFPATLERLTQGLSLEQPADALAELARKIEQAASALVDSLRRQFENRSLPDAVDALVKAGSYEAAASEVSFELEKAEQPSPTRMGPGPVPTAAAPLPEYTPLVIAVEPTLPAQNSVRVITPPVPKAPSLIVDALRSRRDLVVAVWVQTLLVGLLFALLAVALNADEFVGTIDQVVKIFFWGFTVDVGVNSLLEGIKGTQG